MKKWIVSVALVLFVLPSVYASGGIGAFGSWWDSKDYGALYGGGARLGFEIFSGIALEARVSYLASESQDDVIDGRNVSTDLKLVPLEAVVTWTLDVSESIKPYIGAGAGYYLKNVDWKSSADDVIDDAEEKDSVGYFALAGLDIELGSAILFGEAKYNIIQDDDEWKWRGTDTKQKNSLDGFAANIGLKFGF